jgi:hypothetical protein
MGNIALLFFIYFFVFDLWLTSFSCTCSGIEEWATQLDHATWKLLPSVWQIAGCFPTSSGFSWPTTTLCDKRWQAGPLCLLPMSRSCWGRSLKAASMVVFLNRQHARSLGPSRSCFRKWPRHRVLLNCVAVVRKKELLRTPPLRHCLKGPRLTGLLAWSHLPLLDQTCWSYRNCKEHRTTPVKLLSFIHHVWHPQNKPQ